MKKTLSCIGLVLVLNIFVSVQTAAAFGQGPHENRASKKPQQSQGEPSPKGSSPLGFREEPRHQEVRFQQPTRYEHRLPAGYRTLKIAERILYYLNGIFYQPTPYGYQVVTAPMGARVGALPPGYYQVMYGGIPYYVCNNTYYVQGPMGYSIVTPPQGIMPPVPTGW